MLGEERGGDHDAVAEVVHAGADQDHEPGAPLIGAAMHVQRVLVLGLLRVVDVVIVAVGVAPQHELFQQEEREQADQHGDHHALRAAFLERVRQQLEEDRPQQRADGKRDEPRDPRRMQRQRAGRRGGREHAAGERGHDDFSEDVHEAEGSGAARTRSARAGLYVPEVPS